MGKNRTIHQYQMAKLAEWIGDLSSAARIYSELGNQNEGFTLLIRAAVRKSRQSTVERMSRYARRVKKTKGIVDVSGPLFSQLPLTDPTPPNRRNYSVFVVSQAMGVVRMEIRGFGPTGPLHIAAGQIEVPSWEIRESSMQEDMEHGIGLIWVTAETSDPNVQAHLSVDHWGIVKGAAIAQASDVEKALERLDSLITAFGRSVGWDVI